MCVTSKILNKENALIAFFPRRKKVLFHLSSEAFAQMQKIWLIFKRKRAYIFVEGYFRYLWGVSPRTKKDIGKI